MRFFDYIRGFLDIVASETPRYTFIIQKITICYPNNAMKTEITYTPVGCYRPFVKYVCDLNNHEVFKKFKPDHSRIIIGIHTLECCLDLNKEEHITIYLEFIESCVRLINGGR